MSRIDGEQNQATGFLELLILRHFGSKWIKLILDPCCIPGFFITPVIYLTFPEKCNIRSRGKRYTDFFGQHPEIQASEKLDCYRSLGIPENERTEETFSGFRIDHIRDKSGIIFCLTRQEVAGVIQYDGLAIGGSEWTSAFSIFLVAST